MLVGDILLLNIAYFAAYIIRFKEIAPLQRREDIIVLLVLNFTWIIITNNRGSYNIKQIIFIERVLLKLLRTLLAHALTIVAFIVVLKLYNVSRLHLGITYALSIPLFVIWRLLIVQYLKKIRRKGYNYRRVIVVGAGPVGVDVMENLVSNDAHGYKFLGFFDDDPEKIKNNEDVLGSVDKVYDFLMENDVDEIYCALPDRAGEKVKNLMIFSENNLIRFKIVPDFKRYIHKKITVDFINNVPVILLRQEPLQSSFARFQKRTFDIIFSFFVITFIFTWLFPVIAIIIRLDSKGPVFFKQFRSGENNKSFKMYKFRTMTVNNDSDKVQATKNDKRITRVGSFLRKSNLDEIPQFINVLKGDMSVVGPRPHMLKHTEQYSEIVNKYMVRHFVKPGITGYAQVSGYRGETQQAWKMEKRVEHDVWYLENWSFVLDIKIIVLTVVNMFKGEENAG